MHNHASTYWQQPGASIGTIHDNWPNLSRPFHFLERWSYRHVTAQYPSYSAVWNSAVLLAERLSFHLTFDVWKSAVIVALLERYRAALTPYPIAGDTMIIGDGYGFLGALLATRWPDRVTLIDLPEQLAIQRKTFERLGLDGYFVEPHNLDHIADAKLVINVASMQEMSYPEIQRYFRFMKDRHAYFYCLNRMRKCWPDGTEIDFFRYPWDKDGICLLDGMCPFYRHFVGRTLPYGPTFLGTRIPFVNYFDGLHWHRLVRFQ